MKSWGLKNRFYGLLYKYFIYSAKSSNLVLYTIKIIIQKIFTFLLNCNHSNDINNSKEINYNNTLIVIDLTGGYEILCRDTFYNMGFTNIHLAEGILKTSTLFFKHFVFL